MLKDEPRCPVCFNDWEVNIIPVVLPCCARTVCAPCGDKLRHTKLKCPLCRAEMSAARRVSLSRARATRAGRRHFPKPKRKPHPAPQPKLHGAGESPSKRKLHGAVASKRRLHAVAAGHCRRRRWSRHGRGRLPKAAAPGEDDGLNNSTIFRYRCDEGSCSCRRSLLLHW